MEVVGKLKVINDTQTFGSNGFRKREVVVTTDEQYPQMIMVEFIQDKCDLLNSFTVGTDVKININLRGREWINPEGVAKYFNTIQGWRIEKLSTSDNSTAQPVEDFTEATSPVEEEEDDELPF